MGKTRPMLRIYFLLILNSSTLSLFSTNIAKNLFQMALKRYDVKINCQAEYHYRFLIFCRNLKKINRMNRNKKKKLRKNKRKKKRDHVTRNVQKLEEYFSAKKKINQRGFNMVANKFALLTNEEFRNQYLIPEGIMFQNKDYLEKKKLREHCFQFYKKIYDGQMAEKSGQDFKRHDHDIDDFQEKKTFFRKKVGPSHQEERSHGDHFDDHGDDTSYPEASWKRGEYFLHARVLQGSSRRKKSVDWKFLFQGIKNQKKCKSCYALSILDTIEALHYLNYDENILLSIQEILDCDLKSKSCKGGAPTNAIEYILKYGVSYEPLYPYEAKKNVCRADYMNKFLKKSRRSKEWRRKKKERARERRRLRNEEKRKRRRERRRKRRRQRKRNENWRKRLFRRSLRRSKKRKKKRRNLGSSIGGRTARIVKSNSFGDSERQISGKALDRRAPNKKSSKRYTGLKGYVFIDPSVLDLIEALEYGPVVTSFHTPISFRFYNSGVYDTNLCDNISKYSVNHSVVVTGFDLSAPVPFFEARNSWGPKWGDNGYFKIKIGDLSKQNKGLCLFAGSPFIILPYLK